MTRLRSTPFPSSTAHSRCADCGRREWVLLMVPDADGRWLCSACGAALEAEATVDNMLERAFLARLAQA